MIKVAVKVISGNSGVRIRQTRVASDSERNFFRAQPENPECREMSGDYSSEKPEIPTTAAVGNADNGGRCGLSSLSSSSDMGLAASDVFDFMFVGRLETSVRRPETFVRRPETS